jgi:hypothetical protein
MLWLLWPPLLSESGGETVNAAYVTKAWA